MTTFEINNLIQHPNVEKGNVSDGYHTFDDLYKHRIILFIALCRNIQQAHLLSFISHLEEQASPVWRSRKHSDGSSMVGWFIMGVGYKHGEQVTYHIADEYWGQTNFAKELPAAPEWDGHNSDDVINRIMQL